MDQPCVFCIVVTYRPRDEVLRACLDSIRSQATQVIVVDNTEKSAAAPDVGGARYLSLGDNLGIAAAQNRGIGLALAEGADYVWLSDDDTVFPPDFVRSMLAAAATCSERGIRVAALAPAFFDMHAGKVRPFIRHTPFIEGFRPVPGPNAVADAIASGTLIPAEALRQVGLMREDFFLDWVDIEWCWRARRLHGLEVIGVGDVVIRHALGDGLVSFLGRRITVRSAVRHYYIIRNALYLALHSPATAPHLRLQLAWRALLWTALYPLIAPTGKAEHLRASVGGFVDGLLGRLGRRA
jgi:rhamnosyltransferase